MYDLIIRNAHISDGLGNPLIKGDLAVKDGRVAAVGNIDVAAEEIVDAEGLVLSPGVIDIHTHYDAQLTWDKTASPSPALGVTTVVVGNVTLPSLVLQTESGTTAPASVQYTDSERTIFCNITNTVDATTAGSFTFIIEYVQIA